MISKRISNITKTSDGIHFSISSLQSYPLLQVLNVPEDVLINALNKSKYSYDEETKLINIKFERKTVVLLNAPEDITEEVSSIMINYSYKIIYPIIEIGNQTIFWRFI